MGIDSLLNAIQDQAPITGLTHDYYRYPARFSPSFVRAAIEAFTKEGDIVLDPFMGGGTTAVEAKATGRCSVSVDVSELAVFVARVKTTILSQRELDQVAEWARIASESVSPCRPAPTRRSAASALYLRNFPWRIREMTDQALKLARDLPPRAHRLARCSLLRTGQWAVDGKKGDIATAREFREMLVEYVDTMSRGMRELKRESATNRPSSTTVRTYIANQPAEAVSRLETALLRRRKAKLVVTSPPYPGVHVLYHRWQVGGRRETPAPFWISACNDGWGESFYTFGHRGRKTRDFYFSNLKKCFESIHQVIARDGVVVQLVGFNDPDEDLPRYLATMQAAGFEQLGMGRKRASNRFWREVPNRKWHANFKGRISASRERLLIHKPRT